MAEKNNPTWKKSFGDGMSRLWRTEGRRVWQRLEKGLISKYEKSLVAADQDLCDATLEKMVEARGGPGGLKHIEWNFGRPGDPPCKGKGGGKRKSRRKGMDAEEEIEDIGWATLSHCIKQDRNATWAEIVARYSILRREPFLETALLLRDLQQTEGLFYFDDTTSEPIKWSPSTAYRKRVNIEEDWAAIMQANP